MRISIEKKARKVVRTIVSLTHHKIKKRKKTMNRTQQTRLMRKITTPFYIFLPRGIEYVCHCCDGMCCWRVKKKSSVMMTVELEGIGDVGKAIEIFVDMKIENGE